jgi:hypothetical protein
LLPRLPGQYQPPPWPHAPIQAHHPSGTYFVGSFGPSQGTPGPSETSKVDNSLMS